MNVVSLLVAHAQPTVLEEPGECGLDHPSQVAKAAVMLGVAPGNEWFDASGSPAAGGSSSLRRTLDQQRRAQDACGGDREGV